jgi:hypothetical protein
MSITETGIRSVGSAYHHSWAPSLEEPWQTEVARPWLDKQTRLFAIGSCFAANFSRWISLHGVQVYMPGWGLHYNPRSILAELRRAVGEPAPEVLWRSEAEDGVIWIDGMRHMVTGTTSEELQELRSRIAGLGVEAFREGNAFLITLGLSEVWEQRVDGVWTTLNRTPPQDVRREGVHRSRFLTASETREAIAGMIALIREHRGEVQITFTVSPVPLKETFSMPDSRVANVRSKAVLVAALHEVLEELQDPYVSYFPAYEVFWGGLRGPGLWQRDGRHPTAEAIVTACRRFVGAFARDAAEFDTEVPFEVKRV